MANQIYDKGREAFLRGLVDFNAADIRVLLIDSADYTLSLSTHEFLTSVPAAARVAMSGSLTGKTATAGVADADDVTLSNVSGDPSEALLLVAYTGVDSTSRLLLWIDTATGLPVIPNTGNIQIVWSNAAEKIFKL